MSARGWLRPVGRLSLWNRFVIRDSGLPEHLPVGANQHPVDELPDDVSGLPARQPLLRHAETAGHRVVAFSATKRRVGRA